MDGYGWIGVGRHEVAVIWNWVCQTEKKGQESDADSRRRIKNIAIEMPNGGSKIFKRATHDEMWIKKADPSMIPFCHIAIECRMSADMVPSRH